MWTVFSIVLGTLLVVSSGGLLVAKEVVLGKFDAASAGEDLLGGGSGEKSEIKGPINVLMVGIDPRDDVTPPLADSIIVAHIPESMDQVFLFSLPRDLYVEVPATTNGEWSGGKSKINGSMSVGSIVPGAKPDAAKGFKHLAKTVTGVTGVDIFDAGAIVNFGGFKSIVEAMGGVTMTLDQDFESEHLQPSGKARPRKPECQGHHRCEHPYTGPAKQYKKGTQFLKPWEALDVVRQRYTLKKGDYDRQKNQQKFIRGIAKQAMSKDMMSDPTKLIKVMDAAGDSLTFAGGGHSIVDWAIAMRNVDPDSMVTIELPGGGVYEGTKYLGEQLHPSSAGFFDAVSRNQVAEFLVANPTFVRKE
jgi:polyisoprenyl-teichoic acid--peptidoglycan teichoic acid transferase